MKISRLNFLKFLKRLIQKYHRKVFLIVDRHRSHKSKQVETGSQSNEKHIRIFYLPSYCPELNPDEFLNQDVKSHLGKQRLQTKPEMIKKLNGHLKMRQKQPKSFRTLSKVVILRNLHEKVGTINAPRNILTPSQAQASK